MAELVASRVLLTSLRAPMTTIDALAHLVEQLEAVGAEDLPNVAGLLKELIAIHDELSHLSRSLFPSEAGPTAESVADRNEGSARRRPAAGCGRGPGLPAHDARRGDPRGRGGRYGAAAADTAPFRLPAWKDFHTRFRDRYGTGAVVPVRDVVADSGLGFPAGFLGAPRVPAARALTERDGMLLVLIQQAAADGHVEIELMADSYTPIGSPAVGAQLSFPPRREHNENITRAPRLLPHVISLSVMSTVA